MTRTTDKEADQASESLLFTRESFLSYVGGRIIGRLFVLGVCAMLISASAEAGDETRRNMVGGRVGVWVNNGDRGTITVGVGVTQEVSDASPYAEIFYSHFLNKWLGAEVALGVSSRSDLVSDRNNIFGGLNVYPVQFSAKVYPLGGYGPFQLYLQGGMALYFGSQSQQTVGSFFGGNTTATNINYLLGGGVEYMLAESIAMSLTTKYHRISFGSDKFLGLTDFSSYVITLGFAYRLPVGGDDREKPPRPRRPQRRR